MRTNLTGNILGDTLDNYVNDFGVHISVHGRSDDPHLEIHLFGGGIFLSLYGIDLFMPKVAAHALHAALGSLLEEERVKCTT